MRSSLTRSSRLARLAGALSLATLLCASSASAQNEANRSQARELGEKGSQALEKKDFASAETLFAQADQLYHVPTLLLGLARAQANQGKYVEAWESYHRIILEGAPPGANATIARAIDDAKAEIDGVAGKRSKVTLTVTGADSPKVTLDGVAVPSAGLGQERPVNPGKHAVHVEAAGMKPGDGTFTVDPGKATTFSLALEKDASGAEPGAVPPPGSTTPTTGNPPPPGADISTSGGSMNRTLGFVGLGIGGAGLLAGVITGVIAMGKHGDLGNSPCSSKPCSPGDASTFNSDLDSYHSMGTISTIAFVVGGVATAAGVVLLVTAPKKASSAYISPTIGLGTVGAVGRF
jgi:hypothetical protein